MATEYTKNEEINHGFKNADTSQTEDPNNGQLQTVMGNNEEKSHLPAAEPGTAKVISPLRRYVALFLCLVECLLLGGAFFGWATLVYVLVADGIYSHLCPEATKTNSTISRTSLPNGSNQFQTSLKHPTCDAQDEMFSLAFTVGAAAIGLVSFPAGALFDRYGLLPTRLTASALGIAALLSLAFANRDLPWLIFPGSILLAMATVIIILTNTHVASLAGRNASLMVSFYVAGINSSGATFLLTKFVHEVGIPRMYSLSCHASVWLLVIFVTIVVLPRHKVSPPVHPGAVAPSSVQETNRESSSGEELTIKKTSIKETEAITGTNKNELILSINTNDCVQKDDALYLQDLGKVINNKGEGRTNGNKCAKLHDDEALDQKKVGASETGGRKKQTLKQCIFSPLYVIFIYWFTASAVCMNTYYAIFNPRINKLVHGDTGKVSHYTNMLSYAQATAILISPIGGLLMDWSRNSIKKRGVRGEACAIAAIWSISLATLLIFLRNLTDILLDETAMYISVFLQECARGFLFSTALAFLDLTWPPEYFGSLFGLAYFLNGGGSMMQYPYVIWMQKYGTIPLDIFFVGTSVTAAIFPVYITARHFCGRGREETTVITSTRL